MTYLPHLKCLSLSSTPSSESKAWEVDTLRGHTNNVSCVMFHARQVGPFLFPVSCRCAGFATHERLLFHFTRT